jgi:hypothetical protein
VTLLAEGCRGDCGGLSLQAVADSFTAIGNVTLTVDAANGVLQNDLPATGLTVTSADTTSGMGGTVVVNADGSFTYDPPAGFEGVDTFTYEITDGSSTATGTVSVTVDEVVWFIDNSAAAGGDGRFSSPFSSLAEFNAVQGGGGPGDPEADDVIFLFAGSGPYVGGITLLDGQRLVGQGVDLVVDGQVLVPAGSAPLITTAIPLLAGTVEPDPAIALRDMNSIAGLTIDAPAGVGILGDSVAGPTIVDDVTIRDTGAEGILLLGPCTGTFTFGAAVSVTDAGDACVQINGESGAFAGTFNYRGTIDTSTGQEGLSVWHTAVGSTVTFSDGTIDVVDGPGIGGVLNIKNCAGTVTVTSPSMITGAPFQGVFIFDSSGDLTFEDVTIDIDDEGFSAAAVEIINAYGATITLTNLDVTITGDPVAVPGGVPLRAGNLEAGEPTNLIVDGQSSLSVADGEEAIVIGPDVDAPVVLDVTLQSMTSLRNPQGPGAHIFGAQGRLEVTGTTTWRDQELWGLLLTDSSADFTFADVDISGSVDPSSGIGIDIRDCTGTVTVSGGTIQNMGAHGATIDGGTLTMSDVTVTNVSYGVRLNPLVPGVTASTLSLNRTSFDAVEDAVIQLDDTVNLSGTGNTATDYDTFCENNAASVTGTIEFDGPMTCP